MMKLAIPTMGAAGLDSQRAGHFGHCDCFTVVGYRGILVIHYSDMEDEVLQKVIGALEEIFL